MMQSSASTGRRVVAGEDALDHGLYGGHLHAGFGLGGHVAQLGDVVDLGQRLVLFQRRVVEGVLRLLAQRVRSTRNRMRRNRSALSRRYIRPMMVRVLPVPVAMASRQLVCPSASAASTARWPCS